MSILPLQQFFITDFILESTILESLSGSSVWRLIGCTSAGRYSYFMHLFCLKINNAFHLYKDNYLVPIPIVSNYSFSDIWSSQAAFCGPQKDYREICYKPFQSELVVIELVSNCWFATLIVQLFSTGLVPTHQLSPIKRQHWKIKADTGFFCDSWSQFHLLKRFLMLCHIAA